MGSYILDRTYKAVAALPAHRLVALGAGNEATTIPAGHVVPEQILGATTHAQPHVGAPVAVRRFGVAELQVAEAVDAGELVAVDGTDGRIRPVVLPAATIAASGVGNALSIRPRRADPTLEGFVFNTVDAGANASFAISQTPAGADITLATNVGGTITTTLTAIVAALNASPLGMLFSFSATGSGAATMAGGGVSITGIAAQGYPVGVAQGSAPAEDAIVPVLLTL